MLPFVRSFVVPNQVARHAGGLLPGSCLFRQDGPDSASGVLTFRYPGGRRRVAVPVEWILQDGRWYVTRFLDTDLDE